MVLQVSGPLPYKSRQPKRTTDGSALDAGHCENPKTVSFLKANAEMTYAPPSMRGVSMLERVMGIYLALLIATAVGAQSLGDIAKKEKKRRANITKSEPTPVITESDLGDDRVDEAFDASASNEQPNRRPGGRPVIPATVLPTPDSESESVSRANTPPTDTWDDTFAEYQRAYDEGKTFLRFVQSFERHCQDGTPPPPLPPIAGGYWIVNCDSFPDQIAQTQSRMKQIQHECANHARRLGVLPGRARLR